MSTWADWGPDRAGVDVAAEGSGSSPKGGYHGTCRRSKPVTAQAICTITPITKASTASPCADPMRVLSDIPSQAAKRMTRNQIRDQSNRSMLSNLAVILMGGFLGCSTGNPEPSPQYLGHTPFPAVPRFTGIGFLVAGARGVACLLHLPRQPADLSRHRRAG